MELRSTCQRARWTCDGRLPINAPPRSEPMSDGVGRGPMCAFLVRAEFGARANAMQCPLLWLWTCWADRILGERGVCACKPTPYAAHGACPTYGATYALAERTTARCRLASTQLVNGFSMAAPSRVFPAEIRPAFYRTAELRGAYTHTRTHIQEASHSDAAVISTRRWSAFVVAGSISSRQPTVQCIVERQAPELPTLSIIFLLLSPLPPFLSLNACCLSPPITKTLDVHATVSGQRRTHERGRRAEERRSTGVCRLITFRVASEKGVHNTHSHRCCLWWTSPLVRWCTAHRFSSEHQSGHAFFRAITLTSSQ